MNSIQLSEKINRAYQTQDTMQDFNGYLLIKRENELQFAQGFGMADYEANRMSDSDTIFCIGSITKQFTAACVLLLCQRGQLSIDDPIGRYLPDFVNGGHLVIRHMLNMHSGMPEYWNQPGWKENETTTYADAYEFIRTLQGYEPSRQAFSYCNANYVVLGILVERVSGKKLAQFMQESIFSPLGMTRSGFVTPLEPKMLRNVAIGYQSPRLGPPLRVPMIYSTGGAGNIYSTARDLCAWDSALYTDHLLNAGMRREMFTPTLSGYAMGWWAEGTEFSHGGDLPGFSTRITRNARDRSLILLLANTDGHAESNMCHYAAAVKACINEC